MSCHQGGSHAENKPDNVIPPLNRKSEIVNGANNMGVFKVYDQVQCFTSRTQFM